MLIQYYFLKEGSREYDKSELITYLKAQKYTDYTEEGIIKKIYYKNPIINFNATFVISNRTNIPQIDKLSGKYLDTNFFVEFELLSNDYKVDRILDMIQEICKNFDFYVYNVLFEEPTRFDRTLMINVLKVAKKAYKTRSENQGSDEFVKYAKLSDEKLNIYYSYLEAKEAISNQENIDALDYVFVKKNSSRQAFASIDLTALVKGCIIPPLATVVKVKQKDGEFYTKFEFVYKKISKYLESISTNLTCPVYKLNDKYVKKVNKILSGTRFDRVTEELFPVELSNIYDL